MRLTRATLLALGLAAILVTEARSQEKPDRNAPPPAGPASPLHLDPVQRHTLSNGLPVILMERHELPLVVVHVLVRSGATADPPELPGLADLTASLLTEGAGSKSALEIADSIDYLGVRLSTGASWDASWARVFTPVARLEPALGILADVLLRPDFPPDEIDRARKERRTRLLQQRDEPGALARATYQRMLFGTAHRFGVDVAGTDATLRAVTRADVSTFHQAHYTPSSSICIVVGDVRAPSALQALEKALSAWTGAAAPRARPRPVSQPTRREIVLVDKPGAAQSELRFARLGVARSTPDFYVLDVLNTILGGSFTSRLNDNLRERHGYSYGAGSSFLMRAAPGPFVAASAVHTAVTDKAVKEVLNELRRIREPVTADELERAKSYLTLGYAAEFEAVSQLVAKLADQALYDLPDDFFDTYVERIRAVTVDDVARAARKYIDPDRLFVIVVGDRSEVEPALERLKVGRIRVLTVDDLYGRAN